MTAEHYAQYDDHLAFCKQWAIDHPPCWRCGGSAYYLCALPESCAPPTPPATKANAHAHVCDCLHSAYPVYREDRWWRRCMTAKEPYAFGGWKLRDPGAAPGKRKYFGHVTVAEMRDHQDYGQLIAGLDDIAAWVRLCELIHGTEHDRESLERESAQRAKPEKRWHLVAGIPQCLDHQRPLHLRDGTNKDGVAYAFYSCPSRVGEGYCRVKVDSRDL